MRITGTILKAAIDGLFGKLGAIFPWLRGWLDRPVIVVGRQRNWWHMGRTGDGGPSMQIMTYWYVTNGGRRTPEEAEAALGGVKAGSIKHIFKAAGKHEVIAICDFPDGDIMDQSVLGLPIFRLGYSHVVTDVEWLPLRPYEHWAQDLKKLAQG